MKKQWVYMRIEQDDVQSVVKFADTARELSKLCGDKSETIIEQARAFDRGKFKGGHPKYIRVEIIPDESEVEEIPMIQVVQGDILQASEDIIAHQVNCMGVMGSGVAKCVREKYPGVYESYREHAQYMRRYHSVQELLGTNYYAIIRGSDGKPRFIANMFAQHNYGKQPYVYTNYDAIRSCLIGLRNFANKDDVPKSIALPYKVGCVRGGGDWHGVVFPMIQEILGDLNVTLYKYGEE